jgi:hypothetical protein
MAAKRVKFVDEKITYEDDDAPQGEAHEAGEADGAEPDPAAEPGDAGDPAPGEAAPGATPAPDAKGSRFDDLVGLMRAGHRVARHAWLTEGAPERWVAMTRVAGIWVHCTTADSPWPTPAELLVGDWTIVG